MQAKISQGIIYDSYITYLVSITFGGYFSRKFADFHLGRMESTMMNLICWPKCSGMKYLFLALWRVIFPTSRGLAHSTLKNFLIFRKYPPGTGQAHLGVGYRTGPSETIQAYMGQDKPS